MEIGFHRAKVTEVTLEKVGKEGKPAVRVGLRLLDGEETSALIWLSEKAAGMARAQLRILGFDPEAHSLADLNADPERFAGKEIEIEAEEYQGYINARIPIVRAPSQKETEGLDALIGSAKKAPGAAPGKRPETVPPAGAPRGRYKGPPDDPKLEEFPF